MSRRALWLTPYWPPSASIGARRPAALAAHLAARGWTSVVLAPAGNRVEPPLDPAGIGPVDGIPVHWIPMRRRRRQHLPGDIRRLVDRVMPVTDIPDVSPLSTDRFLETARTLHAAERFDVLFSTSPPHGFAVIAAALKEALEIPWVADFRDEWSGNRLLTPWRTDADAQRAREMELRTLGAADRIVTTTPVMTENVRALPGIEPGRVSTIWNGYDEEAFAGLPRHAYGARCELLYGGQLSSYRDPGPLVEALRLLADEDPGLPLRVTFLTERARAERYLRGTEDLRRRGWLRVEDFLPHREALTRAARADALLHILSGADAAHEPVAGKLFEYLRLGRPVVFISDLDGWNARILRETGAGFRIDPTASAVAVALRDLVTRWRRGDLDAPQGDITPYRRDRQALALETVLNAALDTPV